MTAEEKWGGPTFRWAFKPHVELLPVQVFGPVSRAHDFRPRVFVAVVRRRVRGLTLQSCLLALRTACRAKGAGSGNCHTVIVYQSDLIVAHQPI